MLRLLGMGNWMMRRRGGEIEEEMASGAGMMVIIIVIITIIIGEEGEGKMNGVAVLCEGKMVFVMGIRTGIQEERANENEIIGDTEKGTAIDVIAAIDTGQRPGQGWRR